MPTRKVTKPLPTSKIQRNYLPDHKGKTWSSLQSVLTCHGHIDTSRICVRTYGRHPFPREYLDLKYNRTIWKSFFNYHTSVESKTCCIPKHVFISDLLDEFYKYIDVVVHFTRKNHWEIFYPPHPMIRRTVMRCLYDTKVDEVRALVLVTHLYLTFFNSY